MAELTSEQIHSKLRQVLVKALGVDEEDVTNDATVFFDLGAESIDWLDIAFRLEREFGIRVHRDDVLIPFDETWQVQVEGVWLLPFSVVRERRSWIHWELVLGQLNLEAWPEHLTEEQYLELITVDNLSRYIKFKLRQSA